MTPGMTLSFMSLVRNPQCPPSTPLLNTLLIEISIQNFHSTFQSKFCPLPLPPSPNTPIPPGPTPTQIYLKTNFRVAHSTLPQGNSILTLLRPIMTMVTQLKKSLSISIQYFIVQACLAQTSNPLNLKLWLGQTM